jgi:D-alanyl-D-alanine carboxypeptidase/D-alanyl-D-alanine-endopeptidase (penicillin-binding protein 4)
MKFVASITLLLLAACSAPLRTNATSTHFEGSYIVNLTKNSIVQSHHADAYFLPASLMKLFSYYTAKQILGDSLPAFSYKETSDSLIFWGTANPLFLHNTFKDSTVLHLLASSKKPLYFAPKNSVLQPLGSGWAWDDAIYSYSAERSALPLYGNVMTVFTDSASQTFRVVPPVFNSQLNRSTIALSEKFTLQYNPNTHTFDYSFTKLKNDTLQFPFPSQKNLNLLELVLEKKIQALPAASKHSAKTVKIKTPDSLYSQMLKQSDNFLAEHLLLMASHSQLDTLSTESIIDFAQDSLLGFIQSQPRWVDGSGLSRYNLATPKSVVQLLTHLYNSPRQATFLSDLAQNGQAGTLEKRLANQPIFVYAKTGSMSNNQSIAGFITAKNGDVYAFAIMHNNYLEPAWLIRAKVDSLLKSIYLRED